MLEQKADEWDVAQNREFRGDLVDLTLLYPSDHQDVSILHLDGRTDATRGDTRNEVPVQEHRVRIVRGADFGRHVEADSVAVEHRGDEVEPHPELLPINGNA